VVVRALTFRGVNGADRVSLKEMSLSKVQKKKKKKKKKKVSDKDNSLMRRRANTVTYRTHTHTILSNNTCHLIS